MKGLKFFKYILVLLFIVGGMFYPIETSSYDTLSDNKIQIFTTDSYWKYPEITSNMNLNFPRTSTHDEWGVTGYNGITNVKWVMTNNGTQPDIKLRYPKILKVNNVEYDFIFHYYRVDWGCNSTHYLTTINGGYGWATNNWNPASTDASKRNANNLRVGDSGGWIPSFEYNPTPLDYATYSHSRSHNPKIYTKIEIKNSETGEYANIPELAFYVSDIDTADDGFQYVGSPLTHVYQNKSGSTVTQSVSGNVYTFHSGGDYDYENDQGPLDNPGTVIIQSDDISHGKFEVRSHMTGTNRNSHIELGGIMFVGSAAKVVFISDNTDDDLSEFNEHFIGSSGRAIDYQDKATSIAELKRRGFVVVRDDFGNGKNFTDTTKTYEIHVEYRPQRAKTVFIDQTNGNSTLGEREVMYGNPGERIVDSGYQNQGSINTKYFTDRGYALVTDSYTTNPKFDDDVSNIQEVRIILKHTYTTVDKNTYEENKCLNNKCTAKQPKKGC